MRAFPGIRLAAGLALFVGLALATTSQAAAGAAPTLTVHAMECYSGVGSAIFETCHEGYDSSTIVGEVGDDAGAIIITDFQGALGAYVYCRDLTDNEVLYDGSYADSGGGVSFPVEEDDDIVCDVYFIFPASSGGSSVSSEVKTTTTLPATGAGLPESNMLPIMLLAAIVAGLTAFGVTTRRSLR